MVVRYASCFCSGKFGGLQDHSDSASETFSDPFLPLSGVNSIVGRSIVIHSAQDGGRWVCADIQPPKPERAFAEFDMNGVTGQITFDQPMPGAKTIVNFDLKGLASNADQYHVHVKPLDCTDPNGICSSTSVGGHYNPLGADYTKSTCTPRDTSVCEVGDLRYRPS